MVWVVAAIAKKWKYGNVVKKKRYTGGQKN